MTALAARAKQRAWSDVDALFTGRNWLGFTRKRSPLSFHRVVDILHKNSAPTQVGGRRGGEGGRKQRGGGGNRRMNEGGMSRTK